MLWLATTLVQPPKESIHVTWRNKGLATYLLSILVKQHTGIGDGSLDQSLISLQASMDRKNPARRFYLNLGFTDHDLPDNGLSLTSPSFQRTVKDFPDLWIPAEAEKMSLFKLNKGHLQIPHDIVDSTRDGTWRTYGYSRFPYKAKSMMTIESFAKDCPILNCLSLEKLPLTDRPLISIRSPSCISGLILGEKRVSFNQTSWLRTDEIQFLLAFLNRNQQNSFFHVLGPSTTDTLSQLYKTMTKILEESATQ